MPALEPQIRVMLAPASVVQAMPALEPQIRVMLAPASVVPWWPVLPLLQLVTAVPVRPELF